MTTALIVLAAVFVLVVVATVVGALRGRDARLYVEPESGSVRMHDADCNCQQQRGVAGELRFLYHEEGGIWWAESDDWRGYTATTEDGLDFLRAMVRASAREEFGDRVEVFDFVQTFAPIVLIDPEPHLRAVRDDGRQAS